MSKYFEGSFVKKFTQISSENSKPFECLRSGRGAVIHSLPKNKGLRDIGRSMSIVLDTMKSIFENQQQRWLHFWVTETFYYKMQQKLL